MLFPIIIIYNSVIKISTRNNYTFNYTIFKIYISLSQNKQYVCLYSVVATGDGVENINVSPLQSLDYGTLHN